MTSLFHLSRLAPFFEDLSKRFSFKTWLNDYITQFWSNVLWIISVYLYWTLSLNVRNIYRNEQNRKILLFFVFDEILKWLFLHVLLTFFFTVCHITVNFATLRSEEVAYHPTLIYKYIVQWLITQEPYRSRVKKIFLKVWRISCKSDELVWSHIWQWHLETFSHGNFILGSHWGWIEEKNDH